MKKTSGSMSAADYKAARIALGLSCQELAEKLGISRQTVHTRESGKAMIGTEAECAIAYLAHLMGFELTSARKPQVTEALQGRNEPCACGSGRKFKRCCGA